MREPSLDAGVEGNERLTGLTGGLLLAPLAVESLTIAFLKQLITVHIVLGLVLLGPVALKLGSTGYRFGSYYSRRPAYRRKGPPATWLRVLAAGVVSATVVMMVSGVVLLLGGPSSRDSVLPFHKISFIVWAALTGVHILAHLRGVRDSYAREYLLSLPEVQGDAGVPGRASRAAAIGGSVAVGLAVTLIALPDFGPWQRYHFGHHHRHLPALITPAAVRAP